MFRQFDRQLCKEAGGVMPNQGFNDRNLKPVFPNINIIFKLAQINS